MAIGTIVTGGGFDYTTITAWEAAIGTSGLEEGRANDEAFDEAFTINEGTNSNLTPEAGDEHDGTAGTGARVVWTEDKAEIGLDGANYYIGRMEVDAGGFSGATTNQITFTTADAGKSWRGALIHNFLQASTYVVAVPGRGEMLNCAIFDCLNSTGGGSDISGLRLDVNPTFDSQAINCTIHLITRTGGSGGANARGIELADDVNCIVRNTIVTDTSASGTATDYNGDGASTVSETNASSDSTAPGAIATEPVVSSTEFVSNADPFDLSLNSGAESVDAGTDRGTTPTGVNIDAIGRDRDSEGDTWDLGFIEFVAAGGGDVVKDIIGGTGFIPAPRA